MIFAIKTTHKQKTKRQIDRNVLTEDKFLRNMMLCKIVEKQGYLSSQILEG